MELKHIDIANLCVSAANMRAKGVADIANILPSIRARGILVPLIVRPAEGEDRFEIVAGIRFSPASTSFHSFSRSERCSGAPSGSITSEWTTPALFEKS